MKVCAVVVANLLLVVSSSAFVAHQQQQQQQQQRKGPSAFASALFSTPYDGLNNPFRVGDSSPSWRSGNANTNGSLTTKQQQQGGSTKPGSGINLSQRAKMISKAAPQDASKTASPCITVQGGTLKTWSFQRSAIERVQIMMTTEGRPLNAQVDLWQGPDNAPQRMAVYCEDASVRPFNCVLETPGGQNAVAIRNTNSMEFPLQACIEAEIEQNGVGTAGLKDTILALRTSGAVRPRTVQGGAVFTKPFSSEVASIQIFLQTDGRPLNARIELLQGPNNSKHVLDLYSEDGDARPFFLIMETPGSGNVIRIVNTATMEFPLYATVEPYLISDNYYSAEQNAPAAYFVVD